MAMKTIKMKLAGSDWASASELHIRGTVFASGVMHRTPQDVAGALLQLGGNMQAWSEAISGFNGFFALAWQSGTQLVAAVDRVRSIPLFYGENSAGVFVSDDAEWVRLQIGDHAMDPIARDEFKLTGYVTGKDTLYPNVKQLQAGELLHVDLDSTASAVVVHRYFRYWHVEPDAWDEAVLRQDFDAVVTASVQRLIDYAQGRQIVIPLSGGHDSRLIATLLCKLGYRNILTFTYGARESKEAAYSRQVAQALGLDWHFVEYGNEQWRRAWASDERREYQRWASGWVSLPHIQDWVAVRTLQRNDAIESNCVFAPGHTCCRRHTGIPDRAGPDFPASMDVLIDSIMQLHYVRSVGKSGLQADSDTWRERIVERVERNQIRSQVELADAYEKWEWQERQTKFIGNSVRVYEFFGCDWWLPLWDAEFMAFCQEVPLALRTERRWYDDYVKQAYAAQIQIDVHESLSNAENFGLLGKSIRLALSPFPPSVKSFLKMVRHTVLPARNTNSYIASHLSPSELRRLHNEGYRVDGILVNEFLGLAP